MDIEIRSVNGSSQGSGSFAFRALRIEAPYLSSSSLRDVIISFQSGDYLKLKCVSYQELELFGEILIAEAQNASGRFVPVDLETKEIEESYK